MVSASLPPSLVLARAGGTIYHRSMLKCCLVVARIAAAVKSRLKRVNTLYPTAEERGLYGAVL
jgi:hypothetical protein